MKYDVHSAIKKALESPKVQKAIGGNKIDKIIVAGNVINFVTKRK